ncbi:uncharacterized protein LOC106173505 isoform X2 [Lingula anatina]|uniref:Uncharacterized protein LOC106173505 isoform X2 n=1 Tax=Lingula anatina TaxID=7574 RepID=A0A1S3JIZ9_LINAN|nr:uncharacterized protein LOC106173505 isoform X2 [Lingula anatina]|eukprot:XP_013410101.1 uncharacterized protein LOC106173505 isoform X2 [Lingula anatina]
MDFLVGNLVAATLLSLWSGTSALSCYMCDYSSGGKSCLAEPQDTSLLSQCRKDGPAYCMAFLFRDYYNGTIYAFKRTCRTLRSCPKDVDGRTVINALICQETNELYSGRKAFDCRLCCDWDGCNDQSLNIMRYSGKEALFLNSTATHARRLYRLLDHILLGMLTWRLAT